MDLHALIFPAAFLIALIVIGLLLIGALKAVKALTPFIQTHFNAEQLAMARAIAADVTRAVEQAAGKRENRDKYELALREVKVLAASHGIVLTDEQWQSLIEAAVFEVKQIKAAVDTALAPPASVPAPAPVAPAPQAAPPQMTAPLPPLP